MKSQKLIIILLVVILFVLLIPYLLIGAVITGSNIGMRQQPKLTPRPTMESTGDPELDHELSLMSGAKDIATYHMPGFECGWNYDPETKTAYIIALRSDYGGYYVENAQDMPDVYQQDWDNSVQRALTAEKYVSRYFEKSDAEDITTVVQILDYDDRKTPYLTVANGIVGYDAVNGIDLQGQSSG